MLPRFQLRSLFWVVAAIAVLLAFVRQFPRQQWAFGAAALGVAIFVGPALGWRSGRAWEGLYWSVLGGTVVFVCVVGQHPSESALTAGWLLVGVTIAPLCGLLPKQQRWRALALGAVTSCAILAATNVVLLQNVSRHAAEILCALPAGMVLAFTVQRLQYFETEQQHDRGQLAAGVILAVVVGNLIARRFMPW